ncbi:MAG: hypothetical protein HQ485_08550 [Acidobacteria bacterium]|nr:hypothetical protein [Acidobacteriota bacterium]
MSFLQEAQPFIVEIIRPPAQETTVADVLIGALGLAGVFALAALPLGLVAGYLLIQWHARKRPEDDHMPHVGPSMQLDVFESTTESASDQAQSKS